MTYPATIDSTLMTIQIGDGASPENFAHPCTINKSRGLSHKANVKETEVPSCGGGMGKIVRTVTSTDLSSQGTGLLDAATAKVQWADWMASGAKKNCKVLVGTATGYLMYTVPMVLTQFDLTGAEYGELVEASVSVAQADAPTISAHA